MRSSFADSQPSFVARFVRKYRLPIVSGFLIGTSYIPFPPWALFFCQVPLFLFWWRNAENKKQAFAGGWITQFILTLIGFHWVAYTAIEFGHFPVVGGLLTLAGFAIIAHLHYPIAGWIAYWLIKRFPVPRDAKIFVYALTFATCEMFVPMIFPWHLGYPWLWAGAPGAQFTDVIGFQGLNVATILTNALVALAVDRGVLRLSKAPRRAWTPLGIAAVLIIALNLLGLGRDRVWKETDSELNVSIVQGNIGNFEKYMVELHADFAQPITRKYLELSTQALKNEPTTQLLLWPETAFPTVLDRAYLNYPLQTDVRNFLRQNKVALLTGAYSVQMGTRNTYNGLFHLDASGNLATEPYRKSILLVFGETFPFSDYIPYMAKLFPDQGSFARGPGPSVYPLTIEGRTTPVLIGAQICYEGLYPWFSAELAAKGAQIFTNVTNDSWFWAPFEPNQHLHMTLARAIEFRRPLVRSTNTGISTAILASGEVLQKSPIGAEWTGLFKIRYRADAPHTFYEKIVGLWAWALIVAILLIFVIGRFFVEENRK